MAFYLVHAGTKLYKVDTLGVPQELALPAGVTISATRRARFAILDRTIVMTHAPSVNLQIDANLIVRILTPPAPSAAPTAAAGGAGVLTGSYRWLITFVITEGLRIVSESGPSDESDAVLLAAQAGALSSIPTSATPGVNGRRVWRTLNGGEEFFLVGTIADNSTTTFNDNMTDEEASAAEALPDDLGAPPGATPADYIEEIIPWNDRLWALTHNNPDRVYFCGLTRPWAWNEDNYVIVKPAGADLTGGIGFLPRRNELGVGKRRKFRKIIGTDENDFEMIGVNEEIGLWASESPVVIRDIGYFLAEDGVYTYGPDGVKSISRDKVHAWFTEDETFNRAMFPSAFAHYNQLKDGYQLWLCPAGSSQFTHYVLYDVKEQKWFGPHVTDGLVPTCASVFEDNNGLVTPVLGAEDGKIYQMNRPAFRDGAAAITMRVVGKKHSQDDPESTKVWGEMSIFTKPEEAGTLTIRARVGGLEATQGPISVTSLTRVGAVATVTTATNHLFGDGADITIAGADQADYNAAWTITVVDGTTFTFNLGLLTPVTPATGTITALDPIRADISHDLTLDRERLRMLGVGRLCEIEFVEGTIDQGVEIYGYEIDPVNDLGRR